MAEELKDVKEKQRQLRTLQPHLFKEETPAVEANPIKKGLVAKEESSDDHSSSDEEESDGNNSDGLEITNKPVSRLKKLTKTERNLKLLKRLRNQA